MFGEAMRRWPFEPIPNCPGRFVARWKKREDAVRCERLEDVLPGAVWARMEEAESRDAVWHHAFPDGSGGLVVFAKPDGALIVTLGTAEGFARKMRMLAPREYRWLGRPCDSEDEVVTLAVATEEDLRRHRGTGLVDWRAVPPERCFRMERYTSGRSEALPAVLALLRPEDPAAWQLAPLFSLDGLGQHLAPAPVARGPAFDWTVGLWSFSGGPGLRVCVALLEAAGEQRGVFVKRWSGNGLVFAKREEFVPFGTGAARELGPEHLEAATVAGLGWGELAVLSGDAPLDLSPLLDATPPFLAFLACRAARICLLILAKRRRGAERGALGVLPAAVIRLIARRVAWQYDWGQRVAQWAAFETVFPAMHLLESSGLSWTRHALLSSSASLADLLEQAVALLPPFDRAMRLALGRALLAAREALPAAKGLRRPRAAEQLRLTIAQLESSIRLAFGRGMQCDEPA